MWCVGMSLLSHIPSVFSQHCNIHNTPFHMHNTHPSWVWADFIHSHTGNFETPNLNLTSCRHMPNIIRAVRSMCPLGRANPGNRLLQGTRTSHAFRQLTNTVTMHNPQPQQCVHVCQVFSDKCVPRHLDYCFASYLPAYKQQISKEESATMCRRVCVCVSAHFFVTHTTSA